jgi:diaminopimelate decarboxylase
MTGVFALRKPILGRNAKGIRARQGSGAVNDLRGDCLSNRGGHLYIEDCDTVALAEQYGTPVFVVSENRLRHNLRTFTAAFEATWPEGSVKILPSVKASPLVAIQRILTSEGAGADVFGPGELEVAVRGAVPPRYLSVNGSIKDRATIQRAIAIGARIVIDSERELALCEDIARELGRRARVMFRLKPFLADLSLMSDYVPDREIRSLTQIIKYGIPTSDLAAMGRRAGNSPHLDPVGVHMHMGRHSKQLAVWRSWVRHGVLLTKELADQMGGGWLPREMNFGGGFASSQDLDTDVAVKGYPGPSLDETAREITGTLRATLREVGMDPAGIQIEFEPGRAIHCDTGIHLTTVRNVKHDTRNVERTWVEVDTSQMFLGIGGANFNGAKFEFRIANRASTVASTVVDIVGQTCNLELLFHQVSVPEPAVGDVIALLNTGSYIESCACNFNALPRPGTVLVHGGASDLIKTHEDLQQVLARDLVPKRLA